MDLWEELHRGHSLFKGPEAGTWLVSAKQSPKDSPARAQEQEQEKKETEV